MQIRHCKVRSIWSIPDHYPLPNIAAVTANLSEAKIFSKLDLLKGYLQVPVRPDDVDKTCIITPFGSYILFFNIRKILLRNFWSPKLWSYIPAINGHAVW